VTVVAKLPELGKTSHKETAGLVGVASFSDESGKRKGDREIKGGRKELISRGKAKKGVIVACMRKIAVILNAMMRDKVFRVSEHSHVTTSHIAS